MNAAAGNDDDRGQNAALFAEIATLKSQRNSLQAQLAECRRENQRLRERLGES